MSPNDTAKRKENASALIIKCMISPPSSQANNVAVDLGFLAETESSSAEISPPVRGRTSSARQRQHNLLGPEHLSMAAPRRGTECLDPPRLGVCRRNIVKRNAAKIVSVV